ncbi:uncharacterized protein [Oscarella lobularis]|uniref:uncharacterized protein isoform X2 n=1 Tax=Oscarella lobularis TaxID=121494 RepID=UPI003313A47F
MAFRVNGGFVQEEDTGYYAGLVASVYFIGIFLGCYYWGTLADRKGRRMTILLSGITLTIFTFLFAFTNTTLGLAWAIVTRLLSGASNGLLSASKACIADVSDNANQAKRLAYVTTAWGVGLLIGPAVGGLLAEPVRQYPGVFPKGFLETFPYFLPSAVSVFLLLIGVVVIYLFLPETRGSHSSDERSNVSDGVEESSEPMVAFSSESDDVKIKFSLMEKQEEKSDAIVAKTSFRNLLRVKEAKLAVATYCLFAFSVVGSDELASLWMSTKKYRGGLGFREKDIGLFQAILACVTVPLQIHLTHKMETKLGSLMAFYVTCVACVFFMAFQPVISSIERQCHCTLVHKNTYSASLTFLYVSVIPLWTVLFITLFMMRLSINVAYVMIAIFINNSVPKRQVGAINGLALSLAAVTRAVAPSVGASLFAWSISEGKGHVGFLLDYHLVFYFISTVFLISLLLSVYLPSKLQKQKRE